MATMKFMSGLQLDSLSPQSLPMCNNQQIIPKSLPQQGFAQTCYPIYIAGIKMPIAAFSKDEVSALSNFSKIIKMRQKTRVVLKWLNSLKVVLSNVENMFNSSTEEPLTQASFCKDIYAGVYYLDKRVRMLVLRIIKMIQHMKTCQEEWKDVSECKKIQALGMTEKT